MKKLLALLCALVLFATACGGNDDSATETSADDDQSEAGDTQSDDSDTSDTGDESGDTADEPADAGEFDISQIQPAIIKIGAEGTFVNPGEAQAATAAGFGTGFIISPDGTAVTNNHVVTGAAKLDIYLDGETDPINAQILGVSECSDLAVIRIEGDGYPTLSYREEPIAAGLDVFAAGYPVTDSTSIAGIDYTLTRGIVSSPDASGESSWASVDAVLEHDARIRGGNSGGPLVDEQGRVVGVNYAGNDTDDQNYAITIDEAASIIERLAAGENVDSIGVNGQAVITDELSGVWVASVASGSPADIAGIEPGDVITRLQNLPLATDGTLRDYCDVIRTAGSDGVMNVEVLRLSTEEILEGQVNGEPLVQSYSFAQEFQSEVGGGGSAAPAQAYTNYVTVSDDTGVITVDVPVEWADVDGTINENFGPSIWAAPSLTSFQETWDTPGLQIEATADLTAADMDAAMAAIDFSQVCEDGGIQPYEDALYSGMMHVWANCGGTGTFVFVVVATPADGSFLVRALIQTVTEADLAAGDRALETFFVNTGQ